MRCVSVVIYSFYNSSVEYYSGSVRGAFKTKAENVDRRKGFFGAL
jgi:hypothetical protein